LTVKKLPDAHNLTLTQNVGAYGWPNGYLKSYSLKNDRSNWFDFFEERELDGKNTGEIFMKKMTLTKNMVNL